MKIYYKVMREWHHFQQRHHEILVRDCLLPSMRKQLEIKSVYHKEMTQIYKERLLCAPVVGDFEQQSGRAL